MAWASEVRDWKEVRMESSKFVALERNSSDLLPRVTIVVSRSAKRILIIFCWMLDVLRFCSKLI